MTQAGETWAEHRAALRPHDDGNRHCQWEKCGAPFRPGRAHAEFCSPACREARKSWRKARAQTLIDPLLDWNAARGSRHPDDRALAAAALSFVTRRAREYRAELAALAAANPTATAILDDPAHQTQGDRARALRAAGLDNLAIAAALRISLQSVAPLIARADQQGDPRS